MNLYLFNTIINTCWYFFTILFVLYKFTSFFTHVYGFFKFCGKLYNGATYTLSECTNYIFYNRRNVMHNNETIYSKLQGKWNGFKNWMFGKQTDYIPLPNTWVESKTTIEPSEQFDRQISILCEENESTDSDPSESRLNQVFEIGFDMDPINVKSKPTNTYGIEDSNTLFESKIIKTQLQPNVVTLDPKLTHNPFDT